MNEEKLQNLTIEQCDEMALALSEEAAALPAGLKKEGLMNLAQAYRNLAEMKRMVARQVN